MTQEERQMLAESLDHCMRDKCQGCPAVFEICDTFDAEQEYVFIAKRLAEIIRDELNPNKDTIPQ